MIEQTWRGASFGTFDRGKQSLSERATSSPAPKKMNSCKNIYIPSNQRTRTARRKQFLHPECFPCVKPTREGLPGRPTLSASKVASARQDTRSRSAAIASPGALPAGAPQQQCRSRKATKAILANLARRLAVSPRSRDPRPPFFAQTLTTSPQQHPRQP